MVKWLTFEKINTMDTPLAILFLIIVASGFLTGSVGYLLRYRTRWNTTAYLMKVFCGVFFSAVTVLIYEFFLGSTFMTQKQDFSFYTKIGAGCFAISSAAFLCSRKLIDRLVNPRS